ncbi:MAG: RlmE family RNA methyltransferase [Planctomycetota bacterium]|nr:RlmE family RNA methyltransferase [Planctomycetota bacterium]
MRRLHDRFFKQAKREGQLARSYYKLAEIDRRFRILHPGQRVLDLGAAPGAWTEYALSRILPSGAVCAVDLNPLHPRLRGKVKFWQGDASVLPADAFGEPAARFDVILSDMAPSTSGIKTVDQARSLALVEAAARIAETRLTTTGHFVCKIFEGPRLASLRQRLQGAFETVKVFKPEASRSESMETYLVCLFRLPSA